MWGKVAPGIEKDIEEQQTKEHLKAIMNEYMYLIAKEEKRQRKELPIEGKLTPEEFIDAFSSEQIRIPDFFGEYTELYLKLLDLYLINLDSIIKSIREDVHNQEYQKAYQSSAYVRVMTRNMGLADLIWEFDRLCDFLSTIYLKTYPQDMSGKEIEDYVNTCISDIKNEMIRVRKGWTMMQ